MKKYFTSALVLGVLFSLSTAFAQTTPVVDVVADQVDCASLRYPLSLGSKDSRTGGDVTSLQTYLSQTGYLAVDPTGYFGNATKKAVKAFQSANGISPLGNVGPYTRAKIKELSCNGPVAQQPATAVPSSSVTATIQKPLSETTLPVKCPIEMAKCPDGSYSPRTGPNCQADCPKQVITTTNTSPVVEFLFTPTLALQYDSVGKESVLVAKASVKITTGDLPITLYPNSELSLQSIIELYNNNNGVAKVHNGWYLYSDSNNVITTANVIPAHMSAVIDVYMKVPTSQLFAGVYSLRPGTFSYSDINSPKHIMLSSEFKNVNSSNSVAVIGETAPYVTDVNCDLYGNCIITGVRFDIIGNTVSMISVSKTMVSKTLPSDGRTITFKLSDFGITSPGIYQVLVMTQKEGISNNFSINVGNISSASTFSVPVPTPEKIITVVYPNGGEQLLANSGKDVDFRITWTSSNVVGNVAVYLNSISGLACLLGSVPVSQNYFSVLLSPSFRCTNLSSPYNVFTPGQYKVSIVTDDVLSSGRRNAESNNYFNIITATPIAVPSVPLPTPTITVTSPNGGNYKPGDTLNIQWTTTGVDSHNNFSGLNVYQKSKDNAAGRVLSAYVANQVLGGQVQNQGSYNWVIPANIPAGNDYVVYLTNGTKWVESNTFSITANTLP